MRLTVLWRIGLGVTSLGLTLVACGSDTTFGDPAATGGGSDAANPASSGAGGSDGGSTGTGEEECPHTGPPVLDPSGLTPCPTDVCSGGAHCIPNGLVPPDQADSLAACDADSKCVPDLLIETGGNFIPATCTSLYGAEGRCLSECLPQVAEQAESLPQDTCAANERCTPCFDPLQDGAPATGACDLSCDPGPVDDPVSAPKCCEGLGTCVPTTSIPPDQAEQLPVDTCPTRGDELLCVPNTFIEDPDFKSPPCETGGVFNAPGACLPDCLITGFEGIFIGQGTCDAGYSCAPCTNPITMAPTGACD